jgi:CRP-like cAMP-binding protein
VQLEATELFGGLSPDFLGRVLRLAKVCEFSADQSIFYEGDPAEDIFILSEGKVELTYSLPQDPTTEIRITHILPGENFAWSALAKGESLSSHARAMTGSSAYKIPAAALHALFREFPDAGYEVMSRLSRQILERLRETRKELRWLHQGAR